MRHNSEQQLCFGFSDAMDRGEIVRNRDSLYSRSPAENPKPVTNPSAVISLCTVKKKRDQEERSAYFSTILKLVAHLE